MSKLKNISRPEIIEKEFSSTGKTCCPTEGWKILNFQGGFANFPIKTENLPRIGRGLMNVSSNKHLFFRASAVILLISLLFVSFYLRKDTRYTPGELFEENFEPFEAPSYHSDSLTEVAHSSYREKEYALAAKQYQMVRETKGFTGNDTINLLQAVASLEAGYPETAINLLDMVRTDDLKITANWYKALIYLSQGNLLQAIHTLEKIQGGENPYYSKKAKGILDKLRTGIHQEK